MFRQPCLGPIRAILPRARVVNLATFSSSSVIFGDQPNEPLDLDPSFKSLLKDVDISLLKYKDGHHPPAPSRPAPRELEALPIDLPEEVSGEGVFGNSEDIPAEEEDYNAGRRDARKSPAALFGSQSIGQVVLPFELQKSINTLISESDKTMLHSDAKRLFAGEGEGEDTWQTEYELRKYKSLKQAGRHAVRDGTAFASVALPAHYAAIYSVLLHVKQRLESGWKVAKVIDWGAGTGSGLWASMHAFQKPPDAEKGISEDDPQLAHSNVLTYTGIDKREGLVTIAKRLLRNVDRGSLSATWQKTWHEEDKMNRTQGSDTLALSAFMLSALPTAQARKILVKEMWESGAEVMVLIDHNTTTGFECIAEAREYLLNVGRKEFADPAAEEWDIRGSHVVAPCPHDAACPLYHPGSSRLVCSFSQRLQRPSFVRLTKHSGVGHEDTRYSYVVIRRGPRPKPATQSDAVKIGRIGAVGKEALEKEARDSAPVKELILHDDHELEVLEDAAAAVEGLSPLDVVETQSPEQVQEALRLEAFSWPRLVFPPMKRSGHVILDSCTAEGKVMRITIPKSQGKQPFYDARKASWGDIFPHEPKNTPQERYQPSRGKRDGGCMVTQGGDIGKRNKKEKIAKTSYASLADDLKEKKKKLRKERLRAMNDGDED